MKTETMLDVSGMTCGSCARRVRDALARVDGVEDVFVQLSQGNVQVRHDAQVASVDALTRALEQAGYPAKPAA